MTTQHAKKIYHQLVTFHKLKKRNDLINFSNLALVLVDNFRKSPKKSQNVTIRCVTI